MTDSTETPDADPTLAESAQTIPTDYSQDLRRLAYVRLAALQSEAWIYLTPQQRGLAHVLDEWRSMDESDTWQEEAGEVLAAIAPLLASSAAPEPRPGKEGASAFVQECQRKVSHGEALTLLEAGGLIQLAFGNPHVYPVGATFPQQARDMRDRLKAGQVDDVLTWLNQIAAAAGDPPEPFRAE